MKSISNNVVDIGYRQVDHELCRVCTHDKSCLSVCIAIEALVQLAKVRSPMAQLEYIYNVGTQLDLDNSITAKDL